MENNFSGHLNYLIAIFIVEVIRSRRTNLRRAAEICSRVVGFLPQMRSENEALSLMTEIEKDFEEITVLKQALHFGYGDSDIKLYEHEIKEYAAEIFTKDMVASVSFLQDAARPEMDIQKLCLKYPDFCVYLLANNQKQPFLKQLQMA